MTTPPETWRLAAWSGAAAAAASITALALLILFYAIQVPHLQGGGSASLGGPSDVIGIFYVLLIAVFLCRSLPQRDRAVDRLVLGLGVVTMAVAAISGTGAMTNLLNEGVATGIGAVCTVLIGVWIGLYSWRESGAGVLPVGLTKLGVSLGVVLVVSALLVGATFALPRSPVVFVAAVIVAIPGLIAYIAMPAWIVWAAVAAQSWSRKGLP